MSTESTKKALFNYLDKEIKKQERLGKPKKNRNKPEKDVQKKVCQWFEKMGFDYDIINSQGTYNKQAGRYLSGQAISGFSDVIFIDGRTGLTGYVELKAKGRRNSLRENQKEFLKRKIINNAFACVVDCDRYLADIYNQWLKIRENKSKEGAKQFLLSLLPKNDL